MNEAFIKSYKEYTDKLNINDTIKFKESFFNDGTINKPKSIFIGFFKSGKSK